MVFYYRRDFTNPEASDYFVTSVVESCNSPYVDGSFSDDVGGVPEEHGNVMSRINMTSEQLAELQLATAKALAALYRYETDTAGFARIGRKAENEFVGMHCGILDQGVSAFGKADHLVKIDCATETFTTESMPRGAHFWIFNSNKKHALVDSAYADRFNECQDALAQLQFGYTYSKTLSGIS